MDLGSKLPRYLAPYSTQAAQLLLERGALALTTTTLSVAGGRVLSANSSWLRARSICLIRASSISRCLLSVISSSLSVFTGKKGAADSDLKGAGACSPLRGWFGSGWGVGKRPRAYQVLIHFSGLAGHSGTRGLVSGHRPHPTMPSQASLTLQDILVLIKWEGRRQRGEPHNYRRPERASPWRSQASRARCF